MRFEWDIYHKYDDGSQSENCEVKVYDANGNIVADGEIEDHILPAAKERDKKWGRDIPYGYRITGFDDWLTRKDFKTTFLAHGAKGERGQDGLRGPGRQPDQPAHLGGRLLL